MREKGIFKRQGDVLVPLDDRAKEILGKMAEGKKALVEVRTPRNPEFHRMAFAVFNKIGEAKGVAAIVVAKWLEVELGHFDFEKQMDGNYKVEPHSLAFESMSNETFSEFWKEAEVVIKEKIGPQLPPDLFDEIHKIAWEKAA